MLNSNGNENDKENSRSNKQKNQFCKCSTLLHISLSLFCTTKTWHSLVTCFKEKMLYLLTKNVAACVAAPFFLWLLLVFHVAGHYHFAFSHCSCSYWIFKLFFQQNLSALICFFSLMLALYLLSMSLKTSKCTGKKTCLCYFFFPSKSAGGHASSKCDTWDQLTCRRWMIWMDGWTDGHVISEIKRLPLFLTHGAALSTLRARARERALLKRYLYQNLL